MLWSSVCPTVRTTNDGPEQTQAGRSASAWRGVSCPVRTACAAAFAAGAKPPNRPMSRTRAAQGACTPIHHAAGRSGMANRSPAGHWTSSDDTTRNGKSDSSSGPAQRARPSRSACPQACGTANGSAPARTASKNRPI